MKKSVRNLFLLLLVGVFVLNPVVAQAARYSDVNHSHWAYNHIEELSDKNVVKGYPDGKFHPDKYVSYLEILELLKGVKNLPEYEMNNYVVKYKTVLDKYGVPNWAHQAVAVALGEEIITVDNLMAAYSQGLITDFAKDDKFPNRETIAVYYAKALGLKGSENHDVLKYKDIDEIGRVNNLLIGKVNIKNYLANLIEEGIFAGTGSDGNFVPNRPLKRSEMAKITDLSYKYSHRQVETIEGKIIYKTDIESKKLIVIEDSKKISRTIEINDLTKIKINDKIAKYDDLKENQIVTAKVSGKLENKEMLQGVELLVKSEKVEGTGQIQSIDSGKIKIKYAPGLTPIHPDVKLKLTEEKEFGFDPDLKISEIGQKRELRDLYVKDLKVRFVAENGLVKEIYIVPDDTYVNGTVVEVTSDSKFEKDGKLTLKLSNDEMVSFYVNNKQRFGIRPDQLETLKKNDSVKVRVFNDYIAEVHSKALELKTLGYIEKVTTVNNNNFKIRLVQLDGKIINVTLDQSTKFKQPDFATGPLNDATLNRLREKKSLVKVELTGDRATQLEETGKKTETISGLLFVSSANHVGGNYTLNAEVTTYGGDKLPVTILNPQDLRAQESYNFEGFKAEKDIVARIQGKDEPFVLKVVE